MNKQVMNEIWLQVKENHRKLETCQKHDFSIDLTPERPIGKMYQCTQCGGSVDAIEKKWYEKGLAHAENHAKEC